MHKPPIQLKALSKAGAFKEEDFYKELAMQAGHIDAEQAKKFYMALVRVITRRLREKGVVKLPHLGYFALVFQKEKWGLMGKAMGYVKSCYTVKFYVMETWKEYWMKFKEGEATPGSHDPRTKVLNRKL